MNSLRDTWAEIDLPAIEHNAALFHSLLAPSCRLMAVVKADAYGHGAVQTAEAAIRAGARYLGVAFADEAVQLRDAGIQQPILILGYTPPRSVETAVRCGAAVTVFSREVLLAVIGAARRLGRRTVVHIKVDTGLGRLGLSGSDEIEELIREALGSGCIEVEGIFTHFAAADHADASFTRLQYERFRSILRGLEAAGIDIPLKHACNTAATLQYPEYHLDMVRVGIGLYGMWPGDLQHQMAAAGDHTRQKNAANREVRHSSGLKPSCPPGSELQPALQLKTSVAALKRIPEGHPVSYGCTFTAGRQTLVAVLPIGYADGYPRLLSNRGEVLIGNRRAPIIGRICMDQTMVDATDLPDIQIGDEVVLIGSQGDSAVSAGEVAEWADTIHYELVCGIGKRVPRLYSQAKSMPVGSLVPTGFRSGRLVQAAAVNLDSKR
ncbi:alanine racemase [Paenibacillus thalictri]|uniref:Alanine racemase n=1 Tax=Paenibacillus thalictri TaxID=2527873 RepID=A0A4Q9DRK9_9BACL|nr:alanine racemase [Paenibacillus thalictri]TBL79437.1 alanine racemase [Paenibacillus thalictri]